MLKKIFSIFDTLCAELFVFVFMIPVILFILDLMFFVFPRQKLKQRMTQWFRFNLIAPVLMKMLFCRIIVVGRKNLIRDKKYIFLSNHASLLDIPILVVAINNWFNYVMDEDLFKIPVIGGLAARAGDLPISRRYPIKIVAQLRKIKRAVKDGLSIMIFPEGTRSIDGKIQPFKSGAVNLIRDANLPVIPVAIIGSHELLGRKSYFVNPSKITVRIGEPVNLQLQQSDQAISNQLEAEVSRLFMQGQEK
jgi:1-acyl-sn-glycerol-3-phosphate acyltransferase